MTAACVHFGDSAHSMHQHTCRNGAASWPFYVKLWARLAVIQVVVFLNQALAIAKAAA